jgi:hypothetical protein
MRRSLARGVRAAALTVMGVCATAHGQEPAAPPFTANEGGQSRPPVASRTARADAVQRLLDGHDVVSDATLAVAAFALAPPASGPSKVVLAIEVGQRQILPDSLAIGIRVTDERGSVVFNGTDEATVPPAAPDVATPQLYTVEVQLPAGRHIVRVAVVDGAGRQAAVEHPIAIDAARPQDAIRAGALAIGMAPLGAVLKPLARSDVVRSGAVGWVDAAGPSPAGGTLEVLDAAGAVLAGGPLTIDAPGPTGSRVARGVLPVVLLPPGRYDARLSLDARGAPVVRTRRFTLGRLPAPEPEALGQLVSAAVGPFAASDVLDPAVLAPVLDRALEADPGGADDAMRAAVATVRAKGIAAVGAKPFAKREDLPALMLRGAMLLRQGKLEDAANGFRAALRASSEFLPAIVYLGACYAAGGRDREAVGAWQTALVTETASPLVFKLAADGLVRLGDSAQALALVAEAAERWPDDGSLARRHALAVAAREGPAHAADALVRALGQASSPDADLLSLAARLAVLSAARDDEGAAERVEKVKSLAAATGSVPPLLARWDEYFRERGAR